MRTYLVRINLDIKEKNIEDTLRFKIAVDTIKSLSKSTNKIVILSHRGRPVSPSQGGPKSKDEDKSLKPFAKLISKHLKKDVIFIEEFNSAKAKIKATPEGSVIMLENLRFLKGEKSNSLVFSKRLAKLGDTYINNDFATSHHKSASLVGITKFMPSQAGSIIKNEVIALTKLTKNPKHPFVLIVGGAKIKDKAGTIKSLLPYVDKVLLGGGVGNTFSKARGVDIGNSLYEPEMLKKIKNLAKNEKIITPIDNIKDRNNMLDIGPKTRKEYAKIISEAKTIIWAGPMGYFEKEKFAGGNRAIAKAVLANKKSHTVIGGAQTVYALGIKIKEQKHGNVFLSTGGGAMLHFLTGKKLVALAALEKGEPRQRREAIKKNNKSKK